jgi:zinc transport system substrate-binding protein
MSLLDVDPANRSVYEKNYRNFIMELLALDAEIREIFFKNGKDMAFMVFHPAWGYFAEAYGLRQIPVEIEGKEPKPAQMRRLIEHARAKGVKVIFVQPQFSTKSAGIIAKAIGGQVVFANPLDPEWIRNLREQATKFKEALK